MEKESRKRFDVIDVENLFSQWHPDVRKFTANLNQDCAFNIIENSSLSIFQTSKFNEVLNLTNTRQCKLILHSVLNEKSVNNFLKILKDRDNLHPRVFGRGFSIGEIFELVKQDSYHPLLFLELNKKLYIIDGRTRFYCCLFLNVPAKVRILSDNELNRKCNIKAHL